MPGSDDKPIETIRLSEDQKHRLIQQVNDHYHKPVPAERRDLRVPFVASGAVVTVLHPNGTQTRHAVLSRNLSRGGFSFMVGRFIYPDCDALVQLPALDGSRVSVLGRTARCNHYGGMVHEAAVVFSEPLDLERFVKRAGPSGGASAATPHAEQTLCPADQDPPLVLIVDDFKNDRRLYTLWMEKLGFRALEAAQTAEALELMKRHPIEMAVVNASLGEEDGLELIRRLRGDGFGGPVLVVSADSDAAARTHARGAGADEYLTKPFDQIDLRRAIEHLMAQTNAAGDADDAVRSELADNESMKPLLREFVSGLGETVQQLAEAGAAEDCAALAAMCRRLKGSGSGYGFPQITQLSLLVLDQVQMEQRDVEAIREAVDELVSLLKRVRAE